MIRSIRSFVFASLVFAGIWVGTAATAQAQEPAVKGPPVTTKGNVTVQSRDSVSIADVQKAADDLAMAVEQAVRKATEDPAVKVAALKVAKNAVTAAQIVITQQAETLQTVLDALARQIAQASEKQQSKVRNH